MKILRAYTIDIFGLSNGPYNFNFNFDGNFFNAFKNNFVSNGKGACEVILVKSETLITLKLNIIGNIELTCDKSLELFDFPIHVTKELIFKFGHEEIELNENMYVISSNKQTIDISDFLYQYIVLAVPMKKLHPKYQHDDDQDELIYSSGKTSSSEKIDPRWNKLKKNPYNQ